MACEQGTGKTVMSIAMAEEMLGSGEVSLCAIVCPSALKYQWAQALAKFTDLPSYLFKLKKQLIRIPTPPDMVIIDGTPEKRIKQWDSVTSNTEYIILGYETVLSDWRRLRRLKPGLTIADEITAIKSFRAQRSKKLKKYLDTPYRLGLTGTPVENGKPEELFSIMQWVDESVLGRWDLFDESFIVRSDSGVAVRYKNLDVLLEKLKPVMSRVRRTDSDVKGHMPEPVTDDWDVPLEGPLRAVYMDMGRDLYARVKRAAKFGGSGFDVAAYYEGQADEGTAVGRIMAVHKAMEMLVCHPDLVIMSGMEYQDTTNLPKEKRKGSKYAYQAWQSGVLDEVFRSPKLDELKHRLCDLVWAGEKVIIFTKFVPMMEILAEEIGFPSVKFHGGLNAAQKAAAVAEFSDPDGPPVFLVSRAGAFGLDLPVASHLINYDPEWASGRADQVNARHVRASSKFATVYVHNMITDSSIEIRMMSSQAYKREVAAGVLGDKKMREIENNVPSLTSFLEETIDGLLEED